MPRPSAFRESMESIPENIPDDWETESENASASEDEYEDDYEEDEKSSNGSEESFESYHEEDDNNNNNSNQNKSRPQSHKSNIPSRKTSAAQLVKPRPQNGPTLIPHPSQSSKKPKNQELKFEDNPHLPTSRLKQLLDSDLIFFQENEVKDLKKLKELNKALINHLKVYHKYGIQVLEEEFREEKKRERERRDKERRDRELSEKEKQARREEERRKNFDEWKKQKADQKKVQADPLS